ncbi:hypothetical protein KKC32_04335, partial [Patescibacteria group bacterium]|nr:hypothetical protein [Patescibacteria group bacterium]
NKPKVKNNDYSPECVHLNTGKSQVNLRELVKFLVYAGLRAKEHLLPLGFRDELMAVLELRRKTS